MSITHSVWLANITDQTVGSVSSLQQTTTYKNIFNLSLFLFFSLYGTQLQYYFNTCLFVYLFIYYIQHVHGFPVSHSQRKTSHCHCRGRHKAKTLGFRSIFNIFSQLFFQDVMGDWQIYWWQDEENKTHPQLWA